MSQTPSQLPLWLSRHANLGFDSDDVAALLSSIESSQNPPSSSVQLPAEILLRVLEFVPVDYILDWRRVCRGFRDAIDGRILYHLLHQTQLIGFIGSREAYPMIRLTEEQYNKICFLRAGFQYVEQEPNQRDMGALARIWDNTYAVFRIEDNWYNAFCQVNEMETTKMNVTDIANFEWLSVLGTLQLHSENYSFGQLTWSIQLGHAVLDLDLPLERGKNAFDVDIQLGERTIRVAWKEMLFRFLKTEAALRLMFEQKQSCNFTFSLAEDCLREIRRQRLASGLNLDIMADRRHKWALRNLPALFGKPLGPHVMELDRVESTSITALLLLRREASMTSMQKAQLQQLKDDYQAMQRDIKSLERAFQRFKTLLIPTFAFAIELPSHSRDNIPFDPIAWPEELLTTISERVSRWYSQRKVIKQLYTLLSSSNEALEITEDSFDDHGSQS